jgi:hypothetical protein
MFYTVARRLLLAVRYPRARTVLAMGGGPFAGLYGICDTVGDVGGGVGATLDIGPQIADGSIFTGGFQKNLDKKTEEITGGCQTGVTVAIVVFFVLVFCCCGLCCGLPIYCIVRSRKNAEAQSRMNRTMAFQAKEMHKLRERLDEQSEAQEQGVVAGPVRFYAVTGAPFNLRETAKAAADDEVVAAFFLGDRAHKMTPGEQVAEMLFAVPGLEPLVLAELAKTVREEHAPPKEKGA